MRASNGKKKGAHKKGRRVSVSSDEDAPDVSVVGNSLSVSVSGVKELVRAVQEGTPQFQELVQNECSLIYECKVCQNLFRSVANFIYHKRNYCKKLIEFCQKRIFKDRLESQIEFRLSPGDEELLPAACQNGADGPIEVAGTCSDAGNGVVRRVELSPLKTMRSRPMDSESPVVCRLEGLPQTTCAVFQTILPKNAPKPFMHEEISGLSLKSGDAVINEDGKVLSPALFKDKCNICGSRFSSGVALARHAKVYHQPRSCYPCPICKIYLLSAWAVYRHLNKKHHKTEEQIRRLRDAVLSKGVKRPLYELQRPTAEAPVVVSATARTEDEKWIAQFEGELRCTVCGKRFTRRAALVVHSAKCKPVVKKTILGPIAQSPEITTKLSCQKCGQEFARRAVLTSHSQTCKGRSENAARALTCRFCGRLFPRRHPLMVHIKKCLKAPPRSPLRVPMTPPKISIQPIAQGSPSAIQVRRDYNKPSPSLIALPNLSRQIAPTKLEAVVRKLHEQPSIPPPRPTILLSASFHDKPTTSPNKVFISSPNGSRLVLSTITHCPPNSIHFLSPKTITAITTTASSSEPTSPKIIPVIDLEPSEDETGGDSESVESGETPSNNNVPNNQIDASNEEKMAVVEEPSHLLILNEDISDNPINNSSSNDLVESENNQCKNDVINISNIESTETNESSPKTIGCSVIDLEEEPSSVATVRVTPSTSRVNSPTPAAVDTLSDIELHRDSTPSSPLHFTQVIRLETDSDAMSLTSRGTDRSEDSYSPQSDIPSAEQVADDSGVSDDGCLVEVVKNSPFLGFDSPVSQDQLPIKRLNAIVTNLNMQLAMLCNSASDPSAVPIIL